MFVLAFSSFFGAAYTLYMYYYSQHGCIYSGLYTCSLGYVHEVLLLFLHWFILNFVILRMDVAFLGFKVWFVVCLSKLSKILVCGADDIVFILDLCLCLFVLLDLSFCFFWVGLVVFVVFILL